MVALASADTGLPPDFGLPGAALDPPSGVMADIEPAAAGPHITFRSASLDEHSPEELLISALLDSGVYDPRALRVPDTAFRALAEVHAFCLRYQRDTGEAPPVALVAERFPRWRHVPDVHPAWAAREVLDAETERSLRKVFLQLGTAIKDRAFAQAVELMSTAVRAYRPVATAGVSGLDFEVIDDHELGDVCPVVSDRITELTRGHYAGEHWVILADWNVGKSWLVAANVVAALEAGWDAVLFSPEMHAGHVLQRVHTIGLRHLARLPGDQKAYRAAVARWYEQCGSLTVYGSAQGRVDAAVVAGAIDNPKTFVAVDYQGLCHTRAGMPARTDWTAASTVSGELTEVAHEFNVPLLSAVQMNAQGEVAGSRDVARDADAIFTLKKPGDDFTGVRKLEATKLRRGATGDRWTIRFDPTRGRFEDVTPEEAAAIRAAEERTWS
jgi:hypothetical protein